MVNTSDRLELLKSAGEDFEWYPTTNAMIEAVFKNADRIHSILDIGAGDGRVLTYIDKLAGHSLDKFAIEKSVVHIKNMPDDISIVGTDFLQQTLIDKKVDVVFCNPPYSQFEEWVIRIIKEANANEVFLVIPQRWQDSHLIKDIIKQRAARSRVIWQGDFADADRKARAKVHVVKIDFESTRRYQSLETDPFDIWFDEHFSGFSVLPSEDDETKKNEIPRFDISKGNNLIDHLYEFYVRDINFMLNNYKTLASLDPSLLKELGVQIEEVKKGLKSKISGLKYKYWQELFSNLDRITSRLTSASRNIMLEKLNKSCNVDFSVDNAYAIVIWVIKNANKYLNSQVIELFKDLSEPECIKNYKSNQRTWEKNGWRYNKEDHSHYALDYRIVTSKWTAIFSGGFSSWDYTNGLSKKCHEFIGDIITVANNLGFESSDSSKNREWRSGEKQNFYTGKGEILVEVKAFKNGNLHLKFDQDFIKTLNIEASRLLGWIKTPQQAAEEMGIDIDFAKSRFGSNFLIGPNMCHKLLPQMEEVA